MPILNINFDFLVIIQCLPSTVCPQPAVTHTVPGGKLSEGSGRQATLVSSVSLTGRTSFTNAMSRLNVLGAENVKNTVIGQKNLCFWP